MKDMIRDYFTALLGIYKYYIQMCKFEVLILFITQISSTLIYGHMEGYPLLLSICVGLGLAIIVLWFEKIVFYREHKYKMPDIEKSPPMSPFELYKLNKIASEKNKVFMMGHWDEEYDSFGQSIVSTAILTIIYVVLLGLFGIVFFDAKFALFNVMVLSIGVLCMLLGTIIKSDNGRPIYVYKDFNSYNILRK